MLEEIPSEEAILESNGKLLLENRLQIALAQRLYPNLEPSQAVIRYTDGGEERGYSQIVRELLEDNPGIHMELETNFENCVNKIFDKITKINYKGNDVS